MLHFLHIQLKFSFVSIFALLKIFMTYSPKLNRNADINSHGHMMAKDYSSFDALLHPAWSVAPYDLSTPLKQWRYMGEKQDYAEYAELDDVLVFPGKYTSNVKWQVRFSYKSLYSQDNAEALALVVSDDQGRTWTEISPIQSPKNDVQYAAADYDGYGNRNDLHFGLKRSGIRSQKLLIDQLSMIPDKSAYMPETASISVPQAPLASNHQQIINADTDVASNDALDISHYDLASFTELLKSYIEYQNELEAAHAPVSV